MKCVLVTGARGFIGRHSIESLLQRGYEVHAVVSSAADAHFPVPVSSHACNLLDARETSALFARVRPTHLLHLAWYTAHGKFWTSPLNLDWVAASVSMLRAFHNQGGKRAVFAGTCAEYEWSDATLDESSSALRPATLYGSCRNALREIALAFARQEDFSVAWGRLFFLYGPFEHPDRLVPSAIRSLLRGVPAELTHGMQIRDFMHTRDAAHGLVALLDSAEKGPVNVASGRPVALRDVANLIGDLLGRPDLIHLGARTPPALDPPRVVANASLLREKIGFSEAFTLRSGLENVIEWWKRNRDENIPT